MTMLVRPMGVFQPVAVVDELPLNQPVAAEGICVLRTEDEVLAFTDSCPHRGHPLSEGSCNDGVLRCALHGWEFAVPGGEAVSPRAPFGLEFFDTRVVDGVLEVLR